MSHKPKPVLIGAFVVGALVLAVSAIIIFGGGTFFKKRITYVAFFDGSVKGLNVGAPVVFRGVKIGSVKDILLEFNAEDLDFRIPVLLEYEPDRITKGAEVGDPKEYFDKLIKRGLSAQLQLQSMVTGMLMVSLDFNPFKNISNITTYSGYPVIPTVPTKMAELTNTLENIPFEELINSVLETVNGIADIISSPEISENMKELKLLMVDVRKVLHHVDDNVIPLTSTLEDTSIAATKLLKQTNKTLVLVDGLINEDSAPRSELMGALKDFTAAARSIRLLADYIEQHPEALIKGKQRR